jgi:hypothetical protein
LPLTIAPANCDGRGAEGSKEWLMGDVRRTGPELARGLATAAAIALGPAAGAGEVPFVDQVITSTADAASSVTAADLDGDGDMDAVWSSLADDSVTWAENDGGSPAAFTMHSITTSADRATSVDTADVDGDGDVDVLAASSGDDTFAWFENVGGTPAAFVEHVIDGGAAGAASVCAVDADGDGDVDVLAGSNEDGVIAWYENDGEVPPAFARRVVSTAAPGVRAVFAADVNGDGNTDFLSASTFGLDKIAWYESDGMIDPDFVEHVISTTAIGSTSVHAADVDGDGDTDVLSSSGFDNKIAWYENDGAAAPAFTEHAITLSATFARWVTTADIDGDGDADVLSAASSADEIAWYDNDGLRSPSFTKRAISTSAAGASHVSVADMDGDGDLDVLSASNLSDTIALHRNDSPQVSELCPADLDSSGDVGFRDLLIVLVAWGECGPGPCIADIDDDGAVSATDLVWVLQGWGACPLPDALTVPSRRPFTVGARPRSNQPPARRGLAPLKRP